MLKLCLSLVCAAFLSACAHDINRHNAARYAEIGNAALHRGDWDTARQAFARAAVNADLGRAPVRARSVMFYEYARAAGVTCFFDHAEEFLLKSLALDEESAGPIHYPLIELARLYFDQGKFAQAAPYFERSIPAVEKANVLTIDPIGFADLLDEYAHALSMSGRALDATAVRARSAEIRAKHSGAASRTDRTPYGKHCTKKDAAL